MEKSVAELSALEDHLGYWLRLVSNRVSGRFARELQAESFTVAEWVAMRHVFDRPGICSTDLADRIGMTRGAVSKILDKLEEKALIERVMKANDRRSQTIDLTQSGRDWIPVLTRIADDNDREFFGDLDDADRLALMTLLGKIARNHSWNEAPTD